MLDKLTIAAALLVAAVLPLSQAAAAPSAASIAREVDEAIAAELFDESTELAPRTDDATFLRRVSLDLIGDIPSPEQITAFVLDPADNKREQLLARLLDSPYYGQNWARYWRDVVFYRAQEDRANIAANAMVADLADELNDNRPWDEIATGFITAQGDVRENGHTAIIMAQDGRTEETTAEISRVFLGIQIQCAQCHDHPYDRWKREQFHELASFFPRIGVRPVQDMTRRTFEVYSNDRFRARQRRQNNDRRPEAEHRMPDLNNPDAPGAVMQPRFFLTNSTIELGTRDADRRQQLAEWLTDNKWFATALVNRLWTELVGEGFFEKVDDIGPDREPSSPQAVDILSTAFRASGYDVKWLLSAICQTEAYQRQARPRRGPEDTPFVANVPQRLRSDQLLNVLYSALEVDEAELLKSGARNRNPRQQYRHREEFAETFGFDPCDPREEIVPAIPQSLAMMNSNEVNRHLRARDGNLLERLLDSIDNDEALVVELYLRCLSRQPTDEELARAIEYRQGIRRRSEAFEDLLWALINSAEFQHRN